MKNIRALVALFLVAVFLAGTALATTSSINPNVPAQNSPLSSSVLRGNFGSAYNDENTIYGLLTLSSNQLLGTVNAGMAGPLNIPSCATGALSWTPGTGLGCNSINGLVSPITPSLVFTGVDSFNLNAVTLPTKQVGTVLQIGNADSLASRLENQAFSGAAYFTGIRSDGTNAAPTTLQSGDEIAGFNAFGYNGSSIVGPRGSVREFAAQNWTGSAQGTRIDIATTLNNTTTMSPVCGFENDGGVTCPPTVTGGDMGAGRINAAGLFVNGVAVSVGTNAFSSLTAATTTNSIENGSNTQTWNWDGLTTGTALTLSSTGMTTGTELNVSAANAAGTGYAGYFSNSGTGAAYGVYAQETGAANTGYAGYFSNTSTATGYALYANGAAKVAGNLTVTGTCTGCGGGAPAVSTLTAAAAPNTIDNGANAQEWDWNALTTGTALKHTSTGITTGRMLDVEANNVAGTGYAGYFTNTGTGTAYGVYASETGTNNTGYAGYFSNTATQGFAVYANGAVEINSGTYSNSLEVTSSGATGANFFVQATAAGGDQWDLAAGVTANTQAHAFEFYDATQNKTMFDIGANPAYISMPSGTPFGWSSNSSFASSSLDTAISRGGAGVVDVGTGASGSTGGTVQANQYNLNSTLLISATAPTISSGFGTSPSVTNNNGPSSFSINVGTGGTATSGVIGLPTAAHGWNCHAVDNTNVGTIETECVTTSTTSATCTSYSRTAGTALAWSASDILGLSCFPY